MAKSFYKNSKSSYLYFRKLPWDNPTIHPPPKHTHLHTHVHAHTHTCIYTHAYSCTYICTHAKPRGEKPKEWCEVTLRAGSWPWSGQAEGWPWASPVHALPGKGRSLGGASPRPLAHCGWDSRSHSVLKKSPCGAVLYGNTEDGAPSRGGRTPPASGGDILEHPDFFSVLGFGDWGEGRGVPFQHHRPLTSLGNPRQLSVKKKANLPSSR